MKKKKNYIDTVFIIIDTHTIKKTWSKSCFAYNIMP